MSKINRLQAEALAAPVEKSASTKHATTKKTSVAQKAAPKTAIKPTSTKPASPPASKTVAVKKIEKTKAVKVEKEKTPKIKMERDSFTMPKNEYAQFHVLKERLNKLGQPVKKSELLRAGIMLLSAMTDTALKSAMSKVPAIKTGRPKKK